jgi:hypothetical protein
MLYNTKAISLPRVFHGIRFKVNKDWLPVRVAIFFASVIPAILHGKHYICAHIPNEQQLKS